MDDGKGREPEDRYSVTILVDGAQLSFNLNQQREALMREAAKRLQEVENQLRAKGKIPEKDYFRYAAILMASRFVQSEWDHKEQEKEVDAALDEVLSIINK